MAFLLLAGGAFVTTGEHARAGFGTGASYTLPASETVMIKADFNGDGKTDLALLGADLLIYLGNGDGTFTAEAPVALPPNFTDGGDLVAGDFNGDGKTDLLISGVQNIGGVGDTKEIWLLTGKGDGTFNAATLVASAGSGLVPAAIAAGDFNGDGKLDIAYEGGGSGVTVLYGSGNGTFATGFTVDVSGDELGGIAVGDFDRAGKDDLAIGTASGPFGTVYIIRCEGACIQSYPIGTEINPMANTTQLVAADLNGDGNLDIGSPNGWLWGSSSGEFSSEPGFSLAVPSAITAAEIDSDGSLDLVLAGSGYVQTLHYLVDYGMQLAAQYPGITTPIGIVSGDFNGDGLADIAEFNATSLSIMLGNHQPSAPATVTAVAGIGSATVSWTPRSTMVAAPSLDMRSSHLTDPPSTWATLPASSSTASTRARIRSR